MQIRKTQYVDAYFMAVLLDALGDRDQAFQELERAFHEKSPVLFASAWIPGWTTCARIHASQRWWPASFPVRTNPKRLARSVQRLSRSRWLQERWSLLQMNRQVCRLISAALD